MNAPSLISVSLLPAAQPEAPATEAPALRDATPDDSLPLAQSINREINRKIRKIVERVLATVSDDDDGFAYTTVGRTDDDKAKKTLVAAQNALKLAMSRHSREMASWIAACAELSDATDQACKAINVDLASVATSLGLVVSPTSGCAPISKLAQERKAREEADRKLKADEEAAKQEAKQLIEMAREARLATIERVKAERKAIKAERKAIDAKDPGVKLIGV